MQLPIARTTELIEQDLGSELLIYDLRINKAYTLNKTSAIVYKACAGQTFDDLTRQHNFTEELIYLTLDELKKHDLLAEEYITPFSGLSRREAVRRVGLATLTMLPVIASLVAPQASHALSASCAINPACAGSGNCPAGCPTCTGTCGGNPNINCTNLGGSCLVSGGDCRGARCTNTGGRCTSSGQCSVFSTCSSSGICRA